MKLSRPLAVVSALALAALSSLALGGAATAATPGVTYVTVADIGVSAVPVDGTPGWTLYAGTATSGLSGLAATAGAHPRYTFASPMAAGSGVLTGLAASSGFTSDFPNSVFAEFDYIQAPAASWEILFADVPGTTAFTNPAATFQTNFAVGVIPANTSATLAQFDAALASLPTAASVTGMEFFDSTASIYSSAKINGTQFIFTPQPTFTAPTTIAVSDYQTSPGVHIITNGFVPGSGVDVGYSKLGGPYSLLGTLTADSVGGIDFSHWDPTAVAGAYTLQFSSSVPNPQTFDFTATAPVLAATGVPATIPLLIAAFLLFAGLVLAAISLRRRSRGSTLS
jgi:hypothetical protein